MPKTISEGARWPWLPAVYLVMYKPHIPTTQQQDDSEERDAARLLELAEASNGPRYRIAVAFDSYIGMSLATRRRRGIEESIVATMSTTSGYYM